MWLLLNSDLLHGHQMLTNFFIPIMVIQLLDSLATSSLYNNKYMQTINKIKSNYKFQTNMYTNY
jgi:hypothetical protein